MCILRACPSYIPFKESEYINDNATSHGQGGVCFFFCTQRIHFILMYFSSISEWRKMLPRKFSDDGWHGRYIIKHYVSRRFSFFTSFYSFHHSKLHYATFSKELSELCIHIYSVYSLHISSSATTCWWTWKSSFCIFDACRWWNADNLKSGIVAQISIWISCLA